MRRKEFARLVDEGYECLPKWVRERISNVALLIEDEPSEEDREAQGLGDGETLLGLYRGIPLSARGENYGLGMTLPDTITLYQWPIEDAAGDDAENMDVRNPYFMNAVRKIVAETIWHEFAHHFGMDEREVRRREERRDIIT